MRDNFPYIDKRWCIWKKPTLARKSPMVCKVQQDLNDKSKYIPINDHNLFENHVTEAGMPFPFYIGTNLILIFDGKTLPWRFETIHLHFINIGDVSKGFCCPADAICGTSVLQPWFWSGIDERWETKSLKWRKFVGMKILICFAGVPTWTIVIFNRIPEIKGNPICEVWPNIQTYFHGGVGFGAVQTPVSNVFFQNNCIDYYEVYNASEGYFAVQDRIGNQACFYC